MPFTVAFLCQTRASTHLMELLGKTRTELRIRRFVLCLDRLLRQTIQAMRDRWHLGEATYMPVGQEWVPRMGCPGKWNQGRKPAVPWWLQFDPYPAMYRPRIRESLHAENNKQTKTWAFGCNTFSWRSCLLPKCPDFSPLAKFKSKKLAKRIPSGESGRSDPPSQASAEWVGRASSSFATRVSF